MQVKYCSEVIQILIGFFYKHYPNSRLATCVSVIAGSSLCIAGAFIIHDTALNGQHSFADENKSKTGKTKMMDFISVSN